MATEETTSGYVVRRQHVGAAAKQSHVQTGCASGVEARVCPVSDVASLSGTILAPTVCQYIHDLIDGRNFFDPYGADAMSMRALFAIGALQIYFRGEKPSEVASLIHNLRGVLRDVDEFALDDARIRPFFEESIRYLETDTAADTLDRTAGEDEELSASVQCIPTMVSKETLRYYKWLARTLQDPGDIVELGSWMGSSTACLAEGLSQNPRREHTRIHAYDSFIWRDWMRTYTETPELLAANIRAGDSFLDYFWGYTAPFRHLIDVHQSVSKTRVEETALPALEWSGGPIAILVMDFAHDRASNEAMWRVFSPNFQSDRTIVVFNQFGNIPAGEVREFCRDKVLELVPLHKPHSSAKAFRYRKAVV
jgi:Methyltransferase domain